MRLFVAFALVLLTSAPAFAQDRVTLGTGRIFSNDYMGDGRDRWRTGSYTYSHLRGSAAFDDDVARGFGDIIEYRIHGQIISPGRGGIDRPYVGMLSLGAQTHFGVGPWRYAVGADIVAMGPQTGLSNFQERFHTQFGFRPPPTDNQLGDQVFFAARASATYTYRLSDTASIRPFVSAHTGGEDLLRVGVDILIGPVGQRDLWLRDDVTGQPYRGTNRGVTGLSYMVGADVAAVESSTFLPVDQGFEVEKTRARARAGLLWQPNADVSLFYGATYLAPEFQGQKEGQILGSLRLNFNF